MVTFRLKTMLFPWTQSRTSSCPGPGQLLANKTMRYSRSFQMQHADTHFVYISHNYQCKCVKLSMAELSVDRELHSSLGREKEKELVKE